MPKFKPGEIHNPNGRPIGSGSRQKLFNETVLPFKEDLIKKAINMAMEGNEQMLRVFLDRLLPSKPVDEPIAGLDINPELNFTSITEFGKQILTLLSQELITPAQANDLYVLLRHHQENVGALELSEKIKKLSEDLKLKIDPL